MFSLGKSINWWHCMMFKRENLYYLITPESHTLHLLPLNTCSLVRCPGVQVILSRKTQLEVLIVDAHVGHHSALPEKRLGEPANSWVPSLSPEKSRRSWWGWAENPSLVIGQNEHVPHSSWGLLPFTEMGLISHVPKVSLHNALRIRDSSRQN